MNADKLIATLDANAQRIRPLIEGAGDDLVRWRPEPKHWSILEVAAHLLDEEREDFRARVDFLLHRPETKAPPIDPEGWVVARKYNERDPRDTLDAFLEERAHSVTWLRGLEAPAWDHSFTHPIGGTLHAGDILSAWVAHDLLHIRQLTRIHFLFVQEQAKPYHVHYAGDW